MSQHKGHDRFKDDSFTFEILHVSSCRDEIEKLEEYYISKYDSYENGLNATPHGKGHSNTSNFTTLGHKFSDTSKNKMSIAARNNCEANPERLEKLKAGAERMWADPEMRKHHSEVRKGKRLRDPKISDEDVELIRDDWETNQDFWNAEFIILKEEGAKYRKPFSVFVDHYSNKHNVSTVLIRNIIKRTMRKEALPSIKKCQ